MYSRQHVLIDLNPDFLQTILQADQPAKDVLRQLVLRDRNLPVWVYQEKEGVRTLRSGVEINHCWLVKMDHGPIILRVRIEKPDPKQETTCPYCLRVAEFLTGAYVYPHRPDLSDKRFYVCKPCDARVGAHADGRPLGTLANAELRQLRSQAHGVFDPKWKREMGGTMRRREAYRWLASNLRIPEEHCHIGMFDEEMCRRVIQICTQPIQEPSHEP